MRHKIERSLSLLVLGLSAACSGDGGDGSGSIAESGTTSSNAQGGSVSGAPITAGTADGVGATSGAGNAAAGGAPTTMGGSGSGGQSTGNGGVTVPGNGGVSGAPGAGGAVNPIAGTSWGGAQAGSGVGGAVIVQGGMAGAATEVEIPSLIGDVIFDTPSQTFRDSITVGMTTSIASAEIRYTTDGLLPTASSTAYSAPLSLSETTQVRAQAFVSGSASGKVSTAIYVARTIDPTSDLPIIVVDGYGKGKPSDKEVYLDAAVMVFEPVDGTASMAALPTVALRAGYHVRGQSSASFPQTPYKVELWDNDDDDVDCTFLGMPADSDWALLPPYYDRTLIRNPFTFALGKDMGMQAPRTRFAEAYINYEAHAISEADYQGIYWVTETIKNNKVRTDLKQLDEDDTTAPTISGGYIMKFDQMATEEPTLTCTGSDPISGGVFGGPDPEDSGTCWTDLEVMDPDPLNDAQKAWITQYIQEFHDSLHLSPIGDYAAYIDVPSFVDYLLISEVTRNVDAYTRSAYYYKDRNQKLAAGPLWDYNFALGGVGAQEPVPQRDTDTGWHFDRARNVNNWYPKLTLDPAFMQEVKTRYTALRETLLSDASIQERIDTLTAPLAQAIVRDYAKWPVDGIILSETGFTGGPTEPTWEGQVQIMRDFLLARLAWMDENLL